MFRVLLGVTGSVAALKTPDLYRLLRAAGLAVKVVATAPSLYFFDPLSFATRPGSQPPERDRNILILDEDEWPGRDTGRLYARTDKVLHIELRRWADVLLIAPLDANTLAKLALGVCDNCLTCLWRAWDRTRPVLLAPAMNTLMWKHPATARHLRQLAADLEGVDVPNEEDHLALVEAINMRCRRLRIVGPQSKRLACDDVGMGAMADLDELVEQVSEMMALTGEGESA